MMAEASPLITWELRGADGVRITCELRVKESGRVDVGVYHNGRWMHGSVSRDLEAAQGFAQKLRSLYPDSTPPDVTGVRFERHVSRPDPFSIAVSVEPKAADDDA